ncbi:MAG: DUF3106 domain-containing protein [Rhodocyclales bacterium]|nr:DUF3106 domain-containing protein [Rhodocyclales bacterium]
MARVRSGLILAVAFWLVFPPSHAAIVPPLSQPSWSELTAEQKRVLAPLSSEWDSMEGFRRKKWLGIAQRYQSMAPDEQARMQRRMTDWAKLTPDERKRARDKYRSLQKAPAEKKEAVKLKWQEYKELPESEKTRLKTEAARRPTPRPAPSKPAVAPKPSIPSGEPPPAAPVAPATTR